MTKKRALIVEDSSSMRQLIGMALKRMGGVVFDESPNGFEALKQLQNATYDLLVVDINMPVMDGLKLIESVREDATFGQIPIIVVTTAGQSADRDRALALGANAYVTKPVNSLELIAATEKLLSR